MRNSFLLLFLIVFSKNTFSQNYTPIDTADYKERKAFVKDFKNFNQNYISQLKDKYSGKTGKELGKIYIDFETFFVKEIKDKNYTFKSDFEQYVRDLIAEIRLNNPEIPENYKVLIARDNLPNAYCMANGTFIINMGLFNWVENRDQLASILTHEFGHKILEHNLKSQLKRINDNLSNKSKIKTLSEVKYNKASKALTLFKEQAYDNSSTSRKHEIEADSIGFVMYNKTKFKKTEFINALQNLEKFDTIAPQSVSLKIYKTLFDLPAQPFKEKWLAMEDFTGYSYDGYKEKISKDSIASHPEIATRVAFLKTTFKNSLADEKTVSETDEKFSQMKQIARMEVLPNFYLTENYGLGIYTSLQFLQENENETYNKEWLGKFFIKIYEARKNYQLNRYLDRVNPKTQSSSYQQFLNFMWNLSLEELKNISEFYSQQKSS